MHCEILLKCKIVLYFNILYMGWKSWLDANYRKKKKVYYSQPSCIYLTLKTVNIVKLFILLLLLLLLIIIINILNKCDLIINKHNKCVF